MRHLPKRFSTPSRHCPEDPSRYARPHLGALNPGQASRKVRADLTRGDHGVFASAASTWEIAIKAAVGKIDADLDDIISATVDTGFSDLPVRMTHTALVRQLPNLHRDPFDRLLIAQALHEGLTIASGDPLLQAYSVPIVWR